MFTLKFMSFFEDGGHVEVCIRCPHYEARKTRDGHFGITAYTDFTSVDGVERWIKPDRVKDEPVCYDTCFVENEDGKTVGKYTCHQLH